MVEASRFASAFTFQYSKRPGTPAADLPDQLPKAVVQERYERLLALQEEISWAENRNVGAGRSRSWWPRGRDARTLRPRGCPAERATTGSCTSRFPHGAEAPRPGDVVKVTVTHAAPHHLVADSGVQGGLFTVRHTAGGDAWAALQDAPGSGRPAVTLGMPSIGRPQAAPAAAATRC